MELTDDQKKKAWLLLGGLAAIVAVLLVGQSWRAYMGARIPAVPDLSETIIGGRLKAEVLQEGQNTLEFTARTNDGRIISDTVTFDVLPPDPYSPYDSSLPPDPYDPYYTGFPPDPY